MWYVPAGVLETIWLGICAVVSYRFVGSLESNDKDLDRYVWVRSELTDFKGWVRLDEQ